MNKKIMNKPSNLKRIKEVLMENLWVVVLLAPLILVLVLGVKKIRPDAKEYLQSGVKKSSSYISDARTIVASISIEITSTELASIVAKPIGRLLLMRVYFDDKKNTRKGPQVAEANISDDEMNEIFEQLAINMQVAERD